MTEKIYKVICSLADEPGRLFTVDLQYEAGVPYAVLEWEGDVPSSRVRLDSAFLHKDKSGIADFSYERPIVPPDTKPDPPTDDDIDRKLSDRAIKFLRDSWGDVCECPYCRSTKWIVPGFIFELRARRTHSSGSQVVTFPLTPVSCEKCGQTVLVNAIRAELVGPLPETNQPAIYAPAEKQDSTGKGAENE